LLLQVIHADITDTIVPRNAIASDLFIIYPDVDATRSAVNHVSSIFPPFLILPLTNFPLIKKVLFSMFWLSDALMDTLLITQKLMAALNAFGLQPVP
jgi:hypothetical protein